MFDEVKINDLERRRDGVAKTICALASQGYIVNKRKYDQLCMYNILSHAFDSISTFDTERKESLERINFGVPQM